MWTFLPAAAVTVLVITATGRLMLRALRLELEYPLVFAAGAAGLATLLFALCAAQAVYPAVLVVVGAGLAVAGWIVRGGSGKRAAVPWLCGAVLAAYGIFYLLHAMAPEMSPDGATYHLGLVSRYLRQHGFQPVPPTMYAGFPAGIEMLFLFAFVFGGHSAAALVHLSFLPVLAFLMVSYGRRRGSPMTGWCAALLVFASPVVGVTGASAYNDVALACVCFAVFYTLELRREDPSPGLLVLAGILAGFAFAIKYTGYVAILYALGAVAWRERRLRPVAVVAAAAGVVALPWLVKNWILLGNPFSPFLNAVFPNPFVHLSFERDCIRMMRSLETFGLRSWTELPMAAAVRGQLVGVLGPVFLAAPVALLALRHAAGRRLLVAAAVFGSVFASNLGCRFLLPALPFLALGMADLKMVGLALAAAHAVLSWPAVVPLYAGTWRLDGWPVRAALRITPEAAFLEREYPAYGISRMVERLVPPGVKVLGLDTAADAYTSREVLTWFQPSESEVASDIVFAATRPECAPVRRVRFGFEAVRLRRVRLVQTATAAEDQWSVTELRVFGRGRELPRVPDWRLKANPNPWDIGLAFDGSPVTRWKSWEAARPGMYLELDLGVEQEVNALLVECSRDQPGTRMKVEGAGADGRWNVLTETSQAGEDPLPDGLAQAARRELAARGIGFVLINDANDLSGPLRAWGMPLAGEFRGTRLYKVSE